MDTEIFLDLGVGFVMLGLALVIIDFFIVRLIKRIYPDGLQELDSTPELASLDPNERRQYEFIKSRYYDGVAHKMKKLGIMISLIGGLLLGLYGILNLLQK